MLTALAIAETRRILLTCDRHTAARRTTLQKVRTMTTTSFHKSNLGSFGTDLPCDLNGYVHTTAEAWLDAPMDISASDRADEDYMAEWAAELASQTIAAVAESENELADWQAK